MATVTQPVRTGSYIVSEATGWRSRETVTVDATGGALVSGTILGKLTATGKYVALALGTSDGSESVAGVLFEGLGAEEAARVAHVRDAEVFDKALVYPDGADAAQITAINAGLNAIGIAIRTEK